MTFEVSAAYVTVMKEHATHFCPYFSSPFCLLHCIVFRLVTELNKPERTAMAKKGYHFTSYEDSLEMKCHALTFISKNAFCSLVNNREKTRSEDLIEWHATE